MACTMDSLPAEILYHIRDYLDDDRSSISRWSRTSRRFHDLLVPVLLRTVAFDRFRASTKSVQMALAAHPGLTTAIEFKDAHGQEDGCCEHWKDPNYDPQQGESLKQDELRLSNHARDLLSGASTAGKVSSMTIEFRYEKFHTPHGGSLSLLEFGYPQSRRSAWGDEQDNQCRQRLAKIFKAISANMQLKTLHIIGLVPYKTSTFWSPRWKSFVGILRELVLDLQQPDDDIHANYDGFRYFVNDLPKVFFDHMPHLESPGLRMDRIVKIGSSSSLYFPLAPHSLPSLKKLQLKNVIFHAAVFDFLVQHSGTLEVLKLDMCSSSCHDVHRRLGARWTWQHLFEDLLRSDCVLQHLEITPDMTELPRPTLLNFTDDPAGFGDDGINMPYIKRLLKAFRGCKHGDPRTFFWYSSWDCANDLNWRTTWEQYELGEDAAAFNQLMELIETRNGTAGTKSQWLDQ